MLATVLLLTVAAVVALLAAVVALERRLGTGELSVGAPGAIPAPERAREAGPRLTVGSRASAP